MSTPPKHTQRFPRITIVLETCISLFASGCILLAIATLLAYANFTPFMYLVELDNLLYYYLHTQGKEDFKSANTIIFVDMDESTMRQTKGYVPGTKTPRDLQAALLRKVRANGAAAVILDFDYREPASGDGALRQALSLPGCPVIIPRIVYSDPMLPCGPPDNVNFRIKPFCVPTVVDDMVDNKGVFAAHAEVQYAFGIVKGVCSSQEVPPPVLGGGGRLPAASLLAFELAKDGGPEEALDRATAESAHIERFDIRVTKEDMRIASTRGPLYLRVPAFALLLNKVDLSNFPHSIVVIGASHAGADDTHDTVGGEMPGALIHVNALLQLQAGRIIGHDSASGLLVDLAFVFLQSCILGLLCYTFDAGGARLHTVLLDRFGKNWAGFGHLVLKLVQMFVVVTSPVLLLVLLYDSMLGDLFHVNIHAIILPFILSLAEFVFEQKKLYSDELAKRVVARGYNFISRDPKS